MVGHGEWVQDGHRSRSGKAGNGRVEFDSKDDQAVFEDGQS
jgi:hypothetical protein